MGRLLYGDLLSWRSSPDRRPLIIEGVRQCGKTYLMEEFGKREFSSVAKINFGKNHPNRSYLTNMGSFRNGDGTFVPLYAVGSIRVL